MFAKDEVEALTSDMLAAKGLTSCWGINGNRLKSVPLEKLATDRVISSTSFVACLSMDDA